MRSFERLVAFLCWAQGPSIIVLDAETMIGIFGIRSIEIFDPPIVELAMWTYFFRHIQFKVSWKTIFYKTTQNLKITPWGLSWQIPHFPINIFPKSIFISLLFEENENFCGIRSVELLTGQSITSRYKSKSMSRIHYLHQRNQGKQRQKHNIEIRIFTRS